MFKAFIKQNKTFFLVNIIFLILIGNILFFGSQQIYYSETRWRHGNVTSQLNLYTKSITILLSHIKDHILLISRGDEIKKYLRTYNHQINNKNKIQETLIDFTKLYDEIYQIRLLNTAGLENIIIQKEKKTKSIKKKFYKKIIQNIHSTNNNQLNVSMVQYNIENTYENPDFYPALNLSMQIQNNHNKNLGYFIVTIPFIKILKNMTGPLFIQIKNELFLSMESGKFEILNKSPYEFQDNAEKVIRISETETIHYEELSFSKDIKMTIAILHKHIGLKNELLKVVYLSIFLTIIFICLIVFIIFLNISKFREIISSHKAITTSLVELTDWRDRETGEHIWRTRDYSQILTKQLQKNKKYKKIINNSFVEDIFDAAPLHDIGKVGIKDAILMKKNKLSKIEFEKMKEHVLIGKNVLNDIIINYGIKHSFIIMARNIAAYHHEKFNGEGYPENLSGENIPLEARIFSIVDVYDALRSKRYYKSEMPHDEVVKYIKSQSGKHFDPQIIESFLLCKDTLLDISCKNFNLC